MFSDSAEERAESIRNLEVIWLCLAYIGSRRHIGLSDYMEVVITSRPIWGAISAGLVLVFLLLGVSAFKGMSWAGWVRHARLTRRLWLIPMFAAAFEIINLLLYVVEAIVNT